ncbi:MAG: HD domain-containing protein [Elusimicrobiota bacterium]|jgi:poly(A) polymerase|nr:HD domain-containing protein [Elusimicrobiota bacterium]
MQIKQTMPNLTPNPQESAVENKFNIKDELLKILSSPDSAASIKKMDNNGLLSQIFPEIILMKKADNKFYYHPYGLFQHSFETFESLEKILKRLDKYFPKNFKDMRKHLEEKIDVSSNISKIVLLKLAALFHDNAKPETAKKINGKIRFIGHEQRGARKSKEILKPLALNKSEKYFVFKLIFNHMRPSTLTKNIIITKRAANRFFRDIDPLVIEQVLLSIADWHSYKRLKIHSSKELKRQQDSAAKLIEDYFFLKNQKPIIKIIDGHKIMKEFDLKPGPWIGGLLSIVAQKQRLGKINDEKSALALISSKLTQIKKKYKITP